MRLVFVGVCGGLTGAAFAGPSSEFFSGTFGPSTTNWNEGFQVNGFDSQGGMRELLEVNVRLDGEVFGSAMSESLDNAPATIGLTLQATMNVELLASGTQLAEVIPLVDVMFDASAFDGSIDFGGTSGVTFGDLEGSSTAFESTSDVSVLAQFIDVGSVDLVANALGSSSGSGAGNLVTQFMTDAGLSWEIEYKFRVIPSPGSATLLGLGGLIAVRRRR